MATAVISFLVGVSSREQTRPYRGESAMPRVSMSPGEWQAPGEPSRGYGDQNALTGGEEVSTEFSK